MWKEISLCSNGVKLSGRDKLMYQLLDTQGSGNKALIYIQSPLHCRHVSQDQSLTMKLTYVSRYLRSCSPEQLA